MTALRQFVLNYSLPIVLGVFTWLVWGIAFLAVTAGPVRAQGGDVGTLPIIRQTSLLTSGQIAIVRGSPADLAIGSTANSPTEILREWQRYNVTPPAGTHDVQVVSTSWTCHGHTVEVHTPRWENEAGPDGARHWAKRHEEAVEAMQAGFPPDPKTNGAGVSVEPWPEMLDRALAWLERAA